KTCHRRAVSDARLVIECDEPQAPNGLVREIAGLVAARRRGAHARRRPAIHRAAGRVPRHEIRVAVLLQQPRDAVERLVPRNTLPTVRARRAVLGVLQPARAVDEIDESRPLRAQRAAIDRMIRIALDVEDRRLRVLRAIAERIHENPAGHGAVRARVPRLGRFRELEVPGARDRLARREAEQRRARACERCTRERQELAPGHVGHGLPLDIEPDERCTDEYTSRAHENGAGAEKGAGPITFVKNQRAAAARRSVRNRAPVRPTAESTACIVAIALSSSIAQAALCSTPTETITDASACASVPDCSACSSNAMTRRLESSRRSIASINASTSPCPSPVSVTSPSAVATWKCPTVRCCSDFES